jgi:hypothetical protein
VALFVCLFVAGRGDERELSFAAVHVPNSMQAWYAV